MICGKSTRIDKFTFILNIIMKICELRENYIIKEFCILCKKKYI